jgi:alkaline phosphatase D
MTGPEQEQWLLNRLARSQASWNVIAQQTMFSQTDFLAGTGQLFNMDQWDGYAAARQRITSLLQHAGTPNPIVLSGDIHSSWVHDIKADFADPASATVGTEFVGTSITSEFPMQFIAPVLAALPDNPHIRFFDGHYHGYVRCCVTRELWRTDFRVVPTILEDDVDAFTLASFVVVNTQPGALAAP